ncbi:hypothetical protein FO519_006707 [Halicephalobus sp. NKZ332]|nr:hypothetical protein FO519_006707 [Halicephalobus sp. NKZ332]
MFGAFDKLNEEIENMFDIEGPIVVCFKPVFELLSEWHHEKFPDFYLKQYPCFYYYMSENQMTRLLEETKDGIPLPEGYYWDETDPEKDVQTLFETWKHSSSGDYERIQAKVRNLPSSMIRVSGTGEPAAFELTDPCGFLNHLFTQPSHRLKGLGTAAEKGLCVKLIKKGITPAKDVETNNPDVIKSSDKSPYWTRWEDTEGRPIMMMFLKKSGRFPEVAWRSFWIKNEEGKRVDFVSRKFSLPGYRHFLLICSEPDIKLDKLQMFEVFEKLNIEMKNMFGVEELAVVCFNPIHDMFVEWYNKTFPDSSLGCNPCFYYYMTEDQMTRLLEETKDGIPLPEGYYWDKADPEKDAQTLFETWQYSANGDYEGMKAKVRNLPSSMIRVSGTGEPAAFELTDPTGYLNHLFTQPPHRLKGLGTAAEKGLCEKLIKIGMIPFKEVDIRNQNVTKSTDNNPYWTSPVCEMFVEWYNKRFPDSSLELSSCFYYYMTEDQMTRLLEETKDGIPLPEGYCWGEANPEKDARILFETWKHSGPGDYEAMKAKVRNLPSSMIRVSGTGEPAAFELTDPTGYLNHLFTQPLHRVKGLGTAVEKGLCVKLIKRGMIPFKEVGIHNENAVKATNKSPYWTRWEDSEGKPILMTFVEMRGKDDCKN